MGRSKGEELGVVIAVSVSKAEVALGVEREAPVKGFTPWDVRAVGNPRLLADRLSMTMNEDYHMK